MAMAGLDENRNRLAEGGSMKTTVLCATLLCSVLLVAQTQKAPAANDWKSVDDAMGLPGQDQPDGGHKFCLPRGDLKVSVGGIDVKPGFALGSWTGFMRMGSQTEVMGDLVLLENEVGPVMQKLIDSGIEITALHNHLINEAPQVMYMHI